MEQRKTYIDLLRVVAIFFVVVLHIAAVNFNVVAINSYDWRVMNVFDSLCRWAVPCFVMLSGIFFLDNQKPLPFKKLYDKYVLRIVCAFVLFSLFYAIVNPLFWHTGQEKPFFQRLIAGYYHLWFLYMILGLYILAPILRAITASKSITQYFLLLFVIVTLILPTLKQTPLGDTLQYPLEKINLSLLGGFAGYWILGFWIEKYFIGSQTTKTIIHLIAIAALVFTIWITNHLSVRQGRADSYWYEYLRVNVALMACGVFVLFKDKIATIHFSQRAQKIIVFLSQNAFGVYLVHPFFLDCCRYNGLSPLSFNPALSIPVLSIAIFAISLFVSWLLRLIPVLRKYVL